MPKKKSRNRRPNKSTASTASTSESTTADGKLSVEWLEDSCGFEVKRKYKQGDALVQKALRHHVGCIVCGSNEAVFQYRACGRCRTRSYCSQRCQKTDWHNFGHKSECGLRKQMIEAGRTAGSICPAVISGDAARILVGQAHMIVMMRFASVDQASVVRFIDHMIDSALPPVPTTVTDA